MFIGFNPIKEGEKISQEYEKMNHLVVPYKFSNLDYI